jgi:superfamily II DNA or RNA helicase
MELREYQKRTIKQVLELTSKGAKKIMIVAPTGAGKTVISSAIAKEFKSLFIVPRIILADQTKEAFGSNYEILQGDRKPKNENSGVIATIQTLRRRHKIDDEYFKKFELLIIDEYHINSNENYRKELEKRFSSESVLIGVTATPEAENGVTFSGFEYVISTTIEELTSLSYLAKFLIQQVLLLDDSELEINKKTNDFTEESLAVEFSKKIPEVVDIFAKEWKNRKSLIFVPSIKDTYLVQEKLNEFGIESEVYHSKLTKKQLKTIMDNFKSGKLKVIINVSMLTTGFDDREVKFGLIARTTQSSALWVQMIGRFLRPFQNKEAEIIDVTTNLERLGSPLDYMKIPNVIQKASAFQQIDNNYIVSNFPKTIIPRTKVIFSKNDILNHEKNHNCKINGSFDYNISRTGGKNDSKICDNYFEDGDIIEALKCNENKELKKNTKEHIYNCDTPLSNHNIQPFIRRTNGEKTEYIKVELKALLEYYYNSEVDEKMPTIYKGFQREHILECAKCGKVIKRATSYFFTPINKKCPELDDKKTILLLSKKNLVSGYRIGFHIFQKNNKIAIFQTDEKISNLNFIFIEKYIKSIVDINSVSNFGDFLSHYGGKGRNFNIYLYSESSSLFHFLNGFRYFAMWQTKEAFISYDFEKDKERLIGNELQHLTNNLNTSTFFKFFSLANIFFMNKQGYFSYILPVLQRYSNQQKKTIIEAIQEKGRIEKQDFYKIINNSFIET